MIFVSHGNAKIEDEIAKNACIRHDEFFAIFNREKRMSR